MAYPYNYPYNGFAAYQPQQPTQQTGLLRVSGEAEAWNYPMAPGATMMFTDGQRIYVKTTDNSPTGSFRFERFLRDEPQKPEVPDYVTRAEFEAFKASLKPSEVKTGE